MQLKWVLIFIGCLFCMGAYYPESTVLGEHRTQHYVREHDSEGFGLI